MKRTLCVMLLLVLAVPVLLIPASAAEEYIFEHFPDDIMLYGSDFEFAGADGLFFVEGQIPAGSYSVVFTGLGDEAYLSEPLTVSFDSLVFVEDICVPGVIADVTLLVGDVSYSVQVFCGYIESDNFTVLAALPDSEVLFDTAEFVRFTLIPPIEFVMDGFSSLLFWVDGVWQLIRDNALLSSFAAAGLVILCVPIFISLKKATH